ncbi:hypothetical protein PRIPAC_77107 [Pristionchus pacificus]|nr:hypothetical protein PRIPAC_77107 [Pristionchus pacificus]|eukprot:PDM79072.1 hypothetical protein PRIPAC_31651 [Pristionchus pacificus]
MGNNKSSNKQPVAHHPSITEVQRLIDRQNAINKEKVIEALEKLPKFNLKTQDFGSFVDEFNNAQAVLNAKLEVKTAKRVFESLIENEERRLYGQIPEELKRNDDWDGYIKALFDVFHTQAEIRIARRVLTRMEQGSEESVRSFRNRIDNAAGFAYPQSKEERITPSMDAFIFGLRRSLRMKILDRVPENLNKATRRRTQSEAQNGKSSCDRVAAQVKRKLRDFVARGNNIRNAKELFSAISQSGLKGLSVYRATVKREKTEKAEKALGKLLRPKMEGISGFVHFVFDKNTIRVWKMNGIGDGRLYTDLSGFTRVLKIEEEGGF